jgi:hypothetical protein
VKNSFSREGLWWDAANPTDRWTGVLRHDRRKGTSLQISWSVGKAPFLVNSRSYDLIHGIGDNGTQFTLIDAYDANVKNSLYVVPPRIRIYANQLIAGLACNTPDPPAASTTLALLHLGEWWNRSGIEPDFTGEQPGFSARYRPIESVIVYDDGTFQVAVCSEAAAQHSRRASSLRERILFRIEASTPRPLSEFYRLASACGDFLSVACLTLCDVEEFSFVPPKQDGVQLRTGTYHAVPFHKSRDGRSSILGHMLFGFRDIEDRAQQFFGSWLSKIDDLRDARTLYLVGAYGRGYLEQKLLALTQAAEAFHRRFFPDRYLDQADFDGSVYGPLVKAIPESARGPLRQALKDRLRFGNEYSLRRRLNTLFEVHEKVLAVLVNNPKERVDLIVDTRNEFTHFPIRDRTLPGRKQRSRDLKLLELNFVLRLLLESCFLQVMGFESAEIEQFVRRNGFYPQLAARFKNDGAADGLGE